MVVASGTGFWLYDAATGAEVALITGHTYCVVSMPYSPDSQTLPSGGWDGTVRLWDVSTCRLAAPGLVRLELYNALGQLVCTLVDPSPCEYQVPWNARGGQGTAVSSGVYVTRPVPSGRDANAASAPAQAGEPRESLIGPGWVMGFCRGRALGLKRHRRNRPSRGYKGSAFTGSPPGNGRRRADWC